MGSSNHWGFAPVATLLTWKGEVGDSNPHLLMGDWGGDDFISGMGFDSHTLQGGMAKV